MIRRVAINVDASRSHAVPCYIRSGTLLLIPSTISASSHHDTTKFSDTTAEFSFVLFLCKFYPEPSLLLLLL
jgi:hypothetical protein